MKQVFLLASLFVLSLTGFSQAVSCDLSLSGADITAVNDAPIDANMINVNQVVKIKVVIGNFVSGNVAPAGHFRIRIGLGNGFILNPTYNLATAPLSNYFNFTYDLSGSQPQIIGNSIAPLPADFAEFAAFELRSIIPTTSTVSFNFLINNPPGTTTPLSDPTPANNSAANTYTVGVFILPVTFAGVNASVKDCDAQVSWNVKGETNLSRYEVEVSKDGTSYNKATEVSSRNVDKYSVSIPLTESLKSPVLYIRIKSVDKDGRFAYSEVKTVKGQCEQSGSLKLSLYPNPVTGNVVTISAIEGSFSGKYTAMLMDKGGKVYQNQEVLLSDVSQFKFNVGNIAPGSYSIRLISQDKTASVVLDFTKL